MSTNIINGGLAAVISQTQKVMLVDSSGNAIDNFSGGTITVTGNGILGPGSSTDRAVAIYSGTSGGQLLNSAVTIDTNGVVSANSLVVASGATAITSSTGPLTIQGANGFEITSLNSASSYVSSQILHLAASALLMDATNVSFQDSLIPQTSGVGTVGLVGYQFDAMYADKFYGQPVIFSPNGTRYAITVNDDGVLTGTTF
jgi:hypothetical protein